MINPDMVANLPDIELKSDFLRPAVPASGEKPDIMTQLAAARLNAGLDDEPEANIDPRGVIETPDMSLRDDVDTGVSRGQVLLPTIEEEQEILTELSDRYDDESDDNSVYEEDTVEDVQEPVVHRTRSGRVTRPPNNLEPHHRHGRQAHGNSRDSGVNFPLIVKSRGSEVDRIECQYTGAGYTTRQGVVYFNIDDDIPAPRAMSN